MSEVVMRLEQSADPLEVDLATALKAWQNAKRQRGEKPSLGYEPRDINKLGAVDLICRRVQGQASGFDEVGVEYSYEAIEDRSIT